MVVHTRKTRTKNQKFLELDYGKVRGSGPKKNNAKSKPEEVHTEIENDKMNKQNCAQTRTERSEEDTDYIRNHPSRIFALWEFMMFIIIVMTPFVYMTMNLNSDNIINNK